MRKLTRRPSTAGTVTAPVSSAPAKLSGIPNSVMSAMLGIHEKERGIIRPELAAKFGVSMGDEYQRNQIPSAEREADELSDTVHTGSPDSVKADMGARLGADFSVVRFHTGQDAAAQADAIGARAYATGADVYFGTGGFSAPVAAHELVHTVQQGAVQSASPVMSAPAGAIQCKEEDDPDDKSSPIIEFLKAQGAENLGEISDLLSGISSGKNAVNGIMKSYNLFSEGDNLAGLNLTANTIADVIASASNYLSYIPVLGGTAGTIGGIAADGIRALTGFGSSLAESNIQKNLEERASNYNDKAASSKTETEKGENALMQRMAKQASLASQVRGQKYLGQGVTSAVQAGIGLGGAALQFVPAFLTNWAKKRAGEAISDKFQASVDQQKRTLRRTVVNDETGFDDEVEAFVADPEGFIESSEECQRYAEAPWSKSEEQEYNTLLDTKADIGMRRKAAKHFILKANGYSSGKRKELFKAITKENARILTMTVNEAYDRGGQAEAEKSEEYQILKAMNLSPDNNKFDLTAVERQLGLESEEEEKARHDRKMAERAKQNASPQNASPQNASKEVDFKQTFATIAAKRNAAKRNAAEEEGYKEADLEAKGAQQKAELLKNLKDILPYMQAYQGENAEATLLATVLKEYYEQEVAKQKPAEEEEDIRKYAANVNATRWMQEELDSFLGEDVDKHKHK